MANPSSTSSKRLVGLGLRGMRNVSLSSNVSLPEMMDRYPVGSGPSDAGDGADQVCVGSE